MNSEENKKSCTLIFCPIVKIWRAFRSLNIWLQVSAWILLSALVIFFALTVAVAKTVHYTINNFAAGILGVDQCCVETVIINPFGGHVALHGFMIGKPTSGNYSHNLLESEVLNIDLSVRSLFTDTLLIEDLTVKGLSVTYEKPLTAPSNIDAIVAKLSSADDSSKKEAGESVPAEDEDSGSSEFYIAADNIDIDGAQVWVAIGYAPVPMPPVTFKLTDVGKETKLSPAMFGTRMLLNFLNIFNRDYAGMAGNAAGAAVDTVGNVATGTVNAVGNAAGAAVDAGKNLLNFFGSDKKDGENKDDKK
ncbi:MAG: AsmA family protein [Opitutales bacterium]|nr:AsmA family protein [Opitutales bacterium]